MKRFYNEVSVISGDGGFSVHLDGRSIKTPARNPLIIPASALSDAIAVEWRAQGENIDPASMPLTALAQGALDQTVSDRTRIVGRIAAFSDSDMLYFRAEENQAALAEHQAEHWDPLLEWARSRYDVSFELIYGIMHRSQPEETVVRLCAAVEAQDNFTLAAMLSLVGLTGSLIATLALVEGVHDTHRLWPLVNLEELWQEQQWGADELALQTRAIKQSEFDAAARFLTLSQAS